MQKYFKIGEISRLYGIGVDSLRYYERIGLLQPERSDSGYRYYSVREIWKLNIIRDLRELGFSMEQIGRYLNHHSVDTTLSLLEEEKNAIGDKIKRLTELKENVEKRMENIRSARERRVDTITLEHYEERKCCSIPEGYSDAHEMDVLIKRLVNSNPRHLYVIGSDRIGTAISSEAVRNQQRLCYRGVFVMDEQGQQTLPAGDYLTVTYRGSYDRSLFWARELFSYADSHGLKLQGDLLEILLLDIHTTAEEAEQMTELQILAEA